MEQFKKWYNQFNNSLTSKTEKKMQERTWQAVLENILDQFPIEGYGGNPIRQYISKELYGKQ